MEYTSIRVSTLRGDQKIEFDVYLRISEKMILYLRKGDSFEGDRLKRLKEKKLKKMFIPSDSEASYRSYMERNIEMAYDDKAGKDIKTRAEIIQGAQQNNVEEVFENPEKEAAYNSAKDAAGKYVQFLLNNTGSVANILNMENTDKNIAHHGVSVATLSVALAAKLNITDPKLTQMLTLGALLHDYGHHLSGQHIARPLSEFSAEELNLYLLHPKEGAAKVQDKKHFDQQVVRIIAQHEECVDGSGFGKMVEKDLDPLSVIVGTANAMDRLITFENVAKDQAAKKMMIDQVGKHPLNQIKHLSDILKELQT